MNKMQRISRNFVKHVEVTEHLEDALTIEEEVCEKISRRGASIFTSRVIVSDKYFIVEIVIRSTKDLPV